MPEINGLPQIVWQYMPPQYVPPPVFRDDDTEPEEAEDDFESDDYPDPVHTIQDELQIIRLSPHWMITSAEALLVPESYQANCHDCGRHLDKRTVPAKATNTRGRYWCERCCQPCLNCRELYRHGVNTAVDVRYDYCCSLECQEQIFNCTSCSSTELRSRCTSVHRDITNRMIHEYISGSLYYRFCHDCISHYEYCESHNRLEDDRRLSNCCRLNLIGQYHGNPPLRFHAFGKKFGQPKIEKLPEPGQVYLGMELECECHSNSRGDREKGAAILNKAMGKYIWMKNDGSLYQGIEICTHPMTLEYFKTIDWSGFQELLDSGLHFRAWDKTNAGIHIHVGRTAFVSDSHLWKFGEMIVMNPEKTQKFAGRVENDFCRMTVRKNTYGENCGKDMKKSISGVLLKKPGHRAAHYDAVNLSNENTVEVRIFKSSLRLPRILANMEFVDAVVKYTRDLKVSDVKNGALKWSSFRVWLDKQTQYDELLMFVDNGLEQIKPKAMVSV